MDISFIGGAYKTFSTNLNAQECVNFIPVMGNEGPALRGSPGLKEWVDTAKYAEVRGSKKMGVALYVVVGNAVYRISELGSKTTCTGTLDTTSGALPESCMAENGSQLMIVDGKFGYIISSTAVTKITDEDFPVNPESVTYQDGYFVVTYRDSGRCYVSTLNDGSSWDGTLYFNPQGRPDNTLCAFSYRRKLSVLSADTSQLYYNSGDADEPFKVVPGTAQEVGVASGKSVVLLDNALLYLTNKNQVVKHQLGNTPSAIAPPSVEYQISKYSKKSDAVGMGITNIEGHTFYILFFPSANATWAFDIITKEPFRLMSYPEPWDNRWRGNCYAYFAGKHIVGDYQNGKLYELDFDTFLDNAQTVRRVRTAPTIKKEGKWVFHHKLEVFFESGVGLTTGQGSDPQVMLQYSDDGGHTWGNELWRGAGKIGKYKWRAVWNRLGRSRQRNYRLIVSDPVKWVFSGANLEAAVGSA